MNGIYTLGNDGVYDWLAALFASLRRNSPGIPVTLIPFDRRTVRTVKLCAQHGVAIVPETSLREIDQVSEMLWANWPTGFLRKLAAFNGPYEHFLFLDADVLALAPLSPLLTLIAGHPEFVFYHDGDLRAVYRPGPLRVHMVTEHGARGINTGIFGGSRARVALDDARVLVEDYARRRGEFRENAEMAFLNYLLDASGVHCVAFEDILEDIAPSWATQPLRRTASRWLEVRPFEYGRPVVLLHWAGWTLSPAMPRYSLWLSYRSVRRWSLWITTRLAWQSVVRSARNRLRRWRLLRRILGKAPR